MRLYHGSDVESIRDLLAGTELDQTVAVDRHVNGAPGFYLATEHGDAEYFALRRSPGAVALFEVDNEVIDELIESGAVLRPVPRSPMSPVFAGDELYIPSASFDLFNAARAQGRIDVTTT